VLLATIFGARISERGRERFFGTASFLAVAFLAVFPAFGWSFLDGSTIRPRAIKSRLTLVVKTPEGERSQWRLPRLWRWAKIGFTGPCTWVARSLLLRCAWKLPMIRICALACDAARSLAAFHLRQRARVIPEVPQMKPVQRAVVDNWCKPGVSFVA